MAAQALRKTDYFTSEPPRACPLDLVHLARQSMGDSELEAELLALFDRQAAQIAAKLVQGADSPTARADLAHKLKGSARAVGAFAVAAAAENYEHAARVGLAGPAEAASVSEAVAEVRAVLRDLIG